VGSEIEMNMNNEPLAIPGMRKPLLNVPGKGRISVPMRAGVYGQNGRLVWSVSSNRQMWGV